MYCHKEDKSKKREEPIYPFRIKISSSLLFNINILFFNSYLKLFLLNKALHFKLIWYLDET